MNFFNSLEHLAPKCKGCEVVLDYGTNTEYNDKEDSHVCLGCGTKV